MYRLVADWFTFTVLIMQLYYQIDDKTIGFEGSEIPAKWVFCPILFVGAILWKYRREIRGIFKKRETHESIHELEWI